MLACCAVVEFAQGLHLHLVYLPANATCRGLVYIVLHSHKLRQQVNGTESLAYRKALLVYAFTNIL